MNAPPPRDPIRTERLLLRRAEPTDLAAFHEIMTDARAMRYWTRPAHETIEQTREFVTFLCGCPGNGGDDWAIELDGRPVGKAGAWSPPEVGFLLHPRHWGRGYMTEAMIALIPHLFARHEVSALTADVDPRNTGSLRLLDRLGFRETGRAERTLLWGDEWCDSVYLALPRP